MVNNPNIRFAGFADEWVQCKFSNLAEVRRGLTYKPSDVQRDGIRVLRSSNIAEDTFLIKSDDVFVNKEAVKIDKVKNGDILITSANGSSRLVGKHALIKGVDDDTVHGGFMLVARAEKPEFVNAIMSSSWYSKFINNFVSGGNGAIGNLSKSNLEDQKVCVPSEKEQDKIGAIFSTLDHKIGLEERQIALLKDLKKGYLQKMFPKNGVKVPELWFAGFADDWDECKFDECFNFPVSTNSLSRALLNYDEGNIQSVHYGDILIKYPAILNVKNDKIPYITDGSFEKYKSNLLENGDLIFADAAEDETVGKAVEVNGLTEENLAAGLHTIVARSKDKKAEFFLGYYINSNTYHRQLLRLIQGSKVSSISKGNLQKTLVSFPKDFEEQQKIGSFFKHLDDTIARHQLKLDLLKDLKKGLSQQMFV